MENCVFCKIVRGDIPSKKVYEDENVLVFKDLHPVSPVHVLIIPKVHFENGHAMSASEEGLAALNAMFRALPEIVRLVGSRRRIPSYQQLRRATVARAFSSDRRSFSRTNTVKARVSPDRPSQLQTATLNTG